MLIFDDDDRKNRQMSLGTLRNKRLEGRDSSSEGLKGMITTTVSKVNEILKSSSFYEDRPNNQKKNAMKRYNSQAVDNR